MDGNGQNYLSLMYGDNFPNEILTNEELFNIQAKLWTLLGYRIERYTMGDSSSIPVETAGELLKSICFSIGLYLKSSNVGISILNNEDMESFLNLSWTKIESEIKIGKSLLNKIKINTLPIENISFNDTLKGLSTFFKKYDYRFFAHQIPCDIDYQLCHPVSENLQGIEYINEYLRHLIIENKFIRKFDTSNIIMLLESYCPDYKGLLINIYEPVATNALGLQLLNGEIYSLDVTDSDRNQLLYLFQSWSKEEAAAALHQASEKLCSILQITDAAQKKYLITSAENLYPRIQSALPTNNLNNIFLPLYKAQKSDDLDVQFIDGESMDDENLQLLIDEINNCRYLSDKLKIFHQEIHSMSDCIEVLNICFWDKECIELFNTMNQTQLDLLIDFVHQKQNESPDWCSESDWEHQLIKYIGK